MVESDGKQDGKQKVSFSAVLGSLLSGTSKVTGTHEVLDDFHHAGVVGNSESEHLGMITQIGRDFSGDDAYLYKLSVSLKNRASYSSGLIRACVYDYSNMTSAGSVNEPVDNATPYFYSDNVFDTSDLTSSYQVVDFYFNATYMMYANRTYGVGIINWGSLGVPFYVGMVGSGHNFVQWYNGDAATASGATSNCYLKVLSAPYAGGVEPTPTPSPTPTASPEPTATPEYPTSEDLTLWDNVFWYIVYLLVLLVPALLLWWKAGKWGFVSGLICGAVISYMFFGLASNLWGIILVGSVIFVAVVAATRGGN